MKEQIEQLKADKVILEAAQEIADRRGFVPGLCEYVIKEIVEEIDGLENQNADPWKGAKELLDHWEVKTGFREDCFKVSQYVRHLEEKVKQLESQPERKPLWAVISKEMPDSEAKARGAFGGAKYRLYFTKEEAEKLVEDSDNRKVVPVWGEE